MKNGKNSDGTEVGLHVEEERHDERHGELGHQFRAAAEAACVAAAQLAIVVDEADGAEGDGHADDEPDVAVGEIGEQQRGQNQGEEDQRAAHRRRAGLRQVALRPVGTNRLADLPRRQLANEPRPEQEGDDQRGECRDQSPKRDVAKDVEDGVRDVQRIEEMIEHHGELPAPSSSRTTSSIFMPRDPLTSTVSPGCQWATTDAATSACEPQT